jgi:hypothetical protein
MPKLRKAYIDAEAAEASSESSGSDEYEKDSFIASSDEDSDASEEASKPAKKAKVEVKVFSNKTLDDSKVPPKPTGLGSAKKKIASKPYEFRLTFINGVLLRKFLEPAARAVKRMRFVVCQSDPKDPDGFTGFKIECHDPAYTLADRGMFECDVDSNSKESKADGATFCVDASSFMEALLSSTLKETCICITRYEDNKDRVTFESTNNENDVRTVYTCGIVDPTSIDSLDGISIDLGFHLHVQMATLKELSLNAKRCRAPTLIFELYQAVDPSDSSITYSKMCVGFGGENTSGTTDFYIGMRKTTIQLDDGTTKALWKPLENPLKIEVMESMSLEKRSYNEYDNKKLRKFLNNMECQFALVHLCTDNTAQPLVLDCVLGGSKTKHTLIVAPKEIASS